MKPCSSRAGRGALLYRSKLAVGLALAAAWACLLFGGIGAAQAEELKAHTANTYDTRWKTRLTLGGRGGAKLRIESERGSVWLYQKGKRANRIELPEGQPITIGRSAEATRAWGLPAEVSREHVTVTRRGDRVEVVDLGSSNGTRAAQGKHLKPKQPKAYDPRSGEVQLRLGKKGAPKVFITRRDGSLWIEQKGNRDNRIELLEGERITIGRGAEATRAWGLSGFVSREHVAVTRRGEAVVVEDRGSMNGTKVKGHRWVLGTSVGSDTAIGSREELEDVAI